MNDTLLALFGGVPLAGATAFFTWLTIRGANAKKAVAEQKDAEAQEDKARALLLEQDRLRMDSMLNAYRIEIERQSRRAEVAEGRIESVSDRAHRVDVKNDQLISELEFAHQQLRALTGARPTSSGGGENAESPS